MENSEPTQQVEQGENDKNSGPLIIFIVAFILVAAASWQFLRGTEDTNEILQQEPVVEATAVVLDVAEGNDDALNTEIALLPVENSEVTAPEDVIESPKAIVLPALDESDSWLQEKLPELTWRKELLSLLITEDMIRRFVVFTDNFAQGLLAYEHSPFIQPKEKFSIDEQLNTSEPNVWQWDSETSKRFDLYVDLLRSVDSTTLVNQYVEMKPLIDEAYSELGYEDDFTYTLQDAITRVLDMELPKSPMDVTRTSVMYKYHDAKLEALDDSDKLLLRIGKENLLIIKSVLLDINEKLVKKVNSSN
ncbi:DUF3014 domain-containing protein [Colwellia piezophila]|uniref:DUF3014 domain-containing protein n=1 Tax=Colwellia piezophila TaxID=211668 RepID=UPI00036A44FD|nr:DUF3014 domain-containing protein [Colwellia piezophila]